MGSNTDFEAIDLELREMFKRLHLRYSCLESSSVCGKQWVAES